MTNDELRAFKALFSKYCRAEMEKGHCDAAECERCPINNAYEEIERVEKLDSHINVHIKTRQSVFLEQFPEVELTQDGVITICPFVISAAHRGKDGNCTNCSDSCPECRKKFWLAEVEDGSVH